MSAYRTVLAFAGILVLVVMLAGVAPRTTPPLSVEASNTAQTGVLNNADNARQSGVFTSTACPSQKFLVTADEHWNMSDRQLFLPPVEAARRINELDSGVDLDFRVSLGDLGDYFRRNGLSRSHTHFVEKNGVSTFVIKGDHDGGGMTGEIRKIWSMPTRSYYYLHDNILHVFTSVMGDQSFAGGSTVGLRNFVKYLVEHKYPNKTTFLYSHVGWENATSHEKGRTNEWKSSMWLDVPWWENLFSNNPQIVGGFYGHVHQNHLHENAFMFNNENFERTSSVHKISEGVFTQAVESFGKQPAAPPSHSNGPTGEYPYVEVQENQVIIRYWRLNEYGYEHQTHVIKGKTTLDPSAEDEFGYFRNFLDNRTVSNWNHFIGENRSIEVVGVPNPNVFPNPEMRQSDWWMPPTRNGRTPLNPWLVWSGDESAVSYDCEHGQHYVSSNNQFVFTDTSGKVYWANEESPPWTGHKNRYGFEDIPMASEDVKYRMDVRIHSDFNYSDGLTLKLRFGQATREMNQTVLKSDKKTVNLSEGWDTYSFVVRSPSNVTNPDFEVPRLRVLPSLAFNSVGTYRLDELRIYPVREGSTEELVNPEVTLSGKKYSYSGGLGPWEKWKFSAPLEGPKETIEMQASGTRMGMLMYVVKDPKLHTADRPVLYDGEDVIAGENRSSLSDKIYMWGMDGVFTVGDHWTENCQDTPRLVLNDIPSKRKLGMWDISVDSDGRVDVKNLRVTIQPVENIIWTASISAQSTFTVSDLTPWRMYEIYADGSKIGEETADKRGIIRFSHQGGVHTFSVAGVPDLTPPTPFDLISPAEETKVENTAVLTWEASSDEGIGLDHYELWLDGSNVDNVPAGTTSYTLSALSKGTHSWYVNATDKAGNETKSEEFAFEVVEPAKFEFSDLSLSKTEVEPGKSTTASVTVRNTGEKSGSYTVELAVDGQTKTQEVTLDPDASETVSFDITENEVGTYEVSIGGMIESIEVSAPEQPEGGGFPVVPVAGVVAIVVAVIGILAYKRR